MECGRWIRPILRLTRPAFPHANLLEGGVGCKWKCEGKNEWTELTSMGMIIIFLGGNYLPPVVPRPITDLNESYIHHWKPVKVPAQRTISATMYSPTLILKLTNHDNTCAEALRRQLHNTDFFRNLTSALALILLFAEEGY
jgi:hypothetical protein